MSLRRHRAVMTAHSFHLCPAGVSSLSHCMHAGRPRGRTQVSLVPCRCRRRANSFGVRALSNCVVPPLLSNASWPVACDEARRGGRGVHRSTRCRTLHARRLTTWVRVSVETHGAAPMIAWRWAYIWLPSAPRRQLIAHLRLRRRSNLRGRLKRLRHGDSMVSRSFNF